MSSNIFGSRWVWKGKVVDALVRALDLPWTKSISHIPASSKIPQSLFNGFASCTSIKNLPLATAFLVIWNWKCNPTHHAFSLLYPSMAQCFLFSSSSSSTLVSRPLPFFYSFLFSFWVTTYNQCSDLDVNHLSTKNLVRFKFLIILGRIKFLTQEPRTYYDLNTILHHFFFLLKKLFKEPLKNIKLSINLVENLEILVSKELNNLAQNTFFFFFFLKKIITPNSLL